VTIPYEDVAAAMLALRLDAITLLTEPYEEVTEAILALKAEATDFAEATLATEALLEIIES
jgi:hypothetical protein